MANVKNEFKQKAVLTVLNAVLALGVSSQVLADSTPQKKNMADLTKEMHETSIEKCYGVVKAHQNDCATHSNACAGQSSVDNAKDAFIALPKGVCGRIGGSLTSS